jgi:signal transduction histidine kinase
MKKNSKQISFKPSYSELEKRLEEMKRELLIKSEEVELLKTSFLSNISHEIRTPMNAIIGFSSLLKYPDLNEEEKENYIEYINLSSNELLMIIDNIIQTANIESHNVYINRRECCVDDIFDDLYRLYKNKNGRHNVDLILKIRNNEKKLKLITDSGKLKYALSNLIDNALKFTSDGFVEFGYTKNNNKTLKFFVKDTGIGIPENKLDVIFNKFIQIENTNTRKYSGLGVGLTISSSFIDLLGGKITVESTFGKGSVFYFTLPLKQADSNIDYSENKKEDIAFI